MSVSSSTNTSRVISRAYKRACPHRGRCRLLFGKNGDPTVGAIDLYARAVWDATGCVGDAYEGGDTELSRHDHGLDEASARVPARTPSSSRPQVGRAAPRGRGRRRA